jgi:Sulfocyanin (SoxE) domain
MRPPLTFGPAQPSAAPAACRKAVFALLMLVLASGCSAPTRTPENAVNVRLRDFRINLSTRVSGGEDVVFRVYNAAPATHEFVVVPTDLAPDALPIGSDGLSVDEEAFETSGEIADVPSGSTETLALHLSPGHYVFFCNLEGHYLGGMHDDLRVAAGD